MSFTLVIYDPTSAPDPRNPYNSPYPCLAQVAERFHGVQRNVLPVFIVMQPTMCSSETPDAVGLSEMGSDVSVFFSGHSARHPLHQVDVSEISRRSALETWLLGDDVPPKKPCELQDFINHSTGIRSSYLRWVFDPNASRGQ